MASKAAGRAISMMPYDMRLKAYHREKNELFYRLNDMTRDEIDRANKELIRKWRI